MSVDIKGDSKLTLGAQFGGNFGGFGGRLGIFANLFSVTLIGNEGGHLIYPTSQQMGLTQINQGISGGLIVGGGISHTQDANFGEDGGSINNVTSSYVGFSKGVFSISYNSTQGNNTLSFGIEVQVGLIIGFEGHYNITITW